MKHTEDGHWGIYEGSDLPPDPYEKSDICLRCGTRIYHDVYQHDLRARHDKFHDKLGF